MKKSSPWLTFIVLLVGVFVTLEAGAFMGPAQPYIAAHFNVPTEFASLFSTCYYISAIALTPLFGKLGDQIGRKKIVLIGLVIFAVSEYVGAFSPNITIFLIARFVQGIGYACIFPNVFAYISDLFSEEKRGGAVGTFMTFVFVATATGGVLAGFLIQTFSWRAVFLTSAILATIGFVLVYFFAQKNEFEYERPTPNISSALIMMVVIATLVTMPLTIGIFTIFSWQAIGQLTLSLGVLAIMLKMDKKKDSPLFDLKVLKIKGISISSIIITLQNLVMISIITSLTFYAAGRSDWTPVQVGLIASVNFTVGALLSPLVGRYLNKYRPAYLVVTGIVSLFIGVIVFFSITKDSSLWLLLLTVVFVGICSGCLNATLMKIVITEAPLDKKGVGSGLFSFFKDLGVPLGGTFGVTLYGLAVSKGFTTSIDTTMAANNLDPALRADVLAANGGGEISQALDSALATANVSLEQLISQTSALSAEAAIRTVGMVDFGLCAFLIFVSLLLLKTSSKRQAEVKLTPSEGV